MVVFYVSLMKILYDNHKDYIYDIVVVVAIDQILLVLLDKELMIHFEDHQSMLNFDFDQVILLKLFFLVSFL